MVERTRWRKLEEATLIVTSAAGREGEARREVRRILGEVDARPLYMKGNLLVKVAGRTTEEAVEALRGAETATVGRCVPVTVEAVIGPERESMEVLSEAALATVAFREGDTFRIECKRRGEHDFSSQEVQREVGAFLEARTPGRFRFEDPDYLLAIEIYQHLVYIGCVRREAVVHKTITKMRKYAPGTRPLNRAESKLREALEAFRVEVEPGTRALDLGAAPGGWTKVLAGMGAEVVAVDPAALAPEVAALPNVTHFAGRAQEFLEQPQGAPFDLVTNDMNRDPGESAEAVRSLVPLLRPEGAVIMTVKFVTPRRQEHLREAARVLAPLFREFREKHVPHNARETTILLRGRTGNGGNG